MTRKAVSERVLKSVSVRPFRVVISLQGYQNVMGISKDVIRLLGSPTHVSLKMHANGSRIAIKPCAADELMSFKVPERLFTDHSCVFRINSKQFVHSMMLANGMDSGMSYTVPGVYIEKQNAVCFDLKEHQLSMQRKKRQCD